MSISSSKACKLLINCILIVSLNSYTKAQQDSASLLSQDYYAPYHAACFTPAGDFFYAGGGFVTTYSNFLKQWRYDGRFYQKFDKQFLPVYQIHCSDRSCFATGGGYKQGEITEILAWRDTLITRVLAFQASPLSHFAFAKQGKCLVVCKMTGETCLWHISKDSLLKTYSFNKNQKAALAIIDQDVYTLDIKGHLFCWNLKDSLPTESQKLDVCPVLACFSTDARQVLLTDTSQQVLLYDRLKKKRFSLFSCSSEVTALAITDDKLFVAIGTADGKIWIINTANHHQQEIEAHQLRINSLTFSADGKRLISTSQDRTLKMWAIEKGF